jgi:hypothetical protein
VMMNAFRLKLNAQTDNLKSAAALEHQNNIRKKYADIDIIINHPICCGYLLNFCNIQFCAENLNFVCEVHRFQDLFAVDTNIWTKNWKVMMGFTLFLRQHSHFVVIIIITVQCNNYDHILSGVIKFFPFFSYGKVIF